jgi:monosaccharide-transporting ATPase
MVLGHAARIVEFPPTCLLTIPVTLAQPFGAPIRDAYPKEQIYVAPLKIKISDREQVFNNLSSANQQKVVIAKWLATAPRILILDEPTRGIDVAAKGEVHRMISELADKGVSILLISSELPGILACRIA